MVDDLVIDTEKKDKLFVQDSALSGFNISCHGNQILKLFAKVHDL